MIKEYILSVTAAALICSVIHSLLPGKSSMRTVIKLISGLYLSITVISPLLQLDISDYSDFGIMISNEADAITAEGEKITANATGEIIKTKTQAYILDKAAALGADLQVKTELAETKPYAPTRVVISGAASPYVRRQLTEWISQTLGIPEEAQEWTG